MNIRHTAVAALLAGLTGGLVGAFSQPTPTAPPQPSFTQLPGDEPIRTVASWDIHQPWPLQYPTRYYVCWDQYDPATGERVLVYGMPHQMPNYGLTGYLHTKDLLPCLKEQGKLPEDYPLAVSGGTARYGG